MVRATSSTGPSPISTSSSSSSAPVKAKSTYSLPASLYMGNSSNKEKEREKEKKGKMSASEIQTWDQAVADKQTRETIQTGSRALRNLQSQTQMRARSTRVRRRVEKRHSTLWFKDGTLVIRAKSSFMSSGESLGGSKRGVHTKDSKRIAKTNSNNNNNNKSKRSYRGREREDEYVLFKVHQSTLEMHSPVFCDVFGLYSSLCGRSPVDGCGAGVGHGELGEDPSLEASVLSLEEGLDGLPTSHTSEECSQSDEESEDEDAEEEWTSVHEMLEGAPLVDVPESAEDWAEILRLLYGDFFLISSQTSSPNPSLELTLLRPMRLAKKYSMDKIIHQLSAAVLAQWPRSLLAYQNYISGISAAISSSGSNTPEPSSVNGSRTKMSRNHDFVCAPPPHLEPAAAITLANEHESLKSILPIAFYMLSLRSPFVDYPDSSYSSSVYPTSTSGAGAGASSTPTSTSGGAAYLEGARWDLLSSADMRRLYAGQANLRSLIWDKLVCCAASSGSGELVDVGMGGVVPEPPYMFLLPLFQQSCGEAPMSGRESRTRDDQRAQAAREDHHHRDGDPNSDNNEMLENEATKEVECSSNGIRMNNELAEYLYCVDLGCVEGRKMVREKIFMSYVNFYYKKGVLVDLLLPGVSITGGGGGRKLMAGGGWQGPVDLERLLEVLGESEGDERRRGGNGIKLCSVCVLAIRTWARNGGGGGGGGGGGSGSGGGGSGSGGGGGVRGHHHIDGADDRRAVGRMTEKLRKRGREEVVWCELGNVFGFGI